MELKFFILSLACFSCVVPPALSAAILTKAAVSSALAAKGAILAKGVIGAKVAAVTKGVALAKGALAANGAAIGKGIALAKGVAMKGAAIAKGVALAAGAAKGAMILKGAVAKGVMVAKGVAAKGLMLAKGAAAKGLLLAKGAAAAAAAKGAAVVAAKVKGAALAAAAKGKALLAKGALASGAVAAGGLAVAKFGGLSKATTVADMPVAVSYAPSFVVPTVLVPPGHPYNRQALTINELFYQAAEHPKILNPVAEVAGAVGRAAGWAGAIQRALVDQSTTAADLVGALTRRIAIGSAPVVYQTERTRPRFYPAPIVEKIETAY